MSDQPTLYRDMTPSNEFSPRGAWVHDLVEMGLLVPVERCEHGNIHWHWNPVQPDGKPYWNSTGTWCPGSPTLLETDDEQ